ncbi:MAG TPA: NADH-quinone oxidoreductase subunit H [Candidatus Acidoferrum sp.]|nr:NADH-quinone oxidoreductase subunit H [Candidatus Acidoferrum sp.]
MNVSVQTVGTFLQAWWAEFAWAAVLLVVALYGFWRTAAQQEGGTESAQPAIETTNDIPEPTTFDSWLRPVIVLLACLISLAAVYFGPALRVADDINIGILFVVGFSSLGVLGAFFPLENSNADVGALSSVQGLLKLVSYQTLGWVAIASGLLLSGSFRVREIVNAQLESHSWFVFLAPMGFFLYLLAGLILANCMLADGSKSNRSHSSIESVANYWSAIVIAAIAATVFLGGWLRPFPNVRWLNWLDFTPGVLLLGISVFYFYKPSNRRTPWFSIFVCASAALVLLTPWFLPSLRFALPGLNGAFWFLVKVKIGVSALKWQRFSLPNSSFASLLQLCWKVLVPLAVLNMFAVGVAMLLASELGWNRWILMACSSTFSLIASVFLVRWRNAPVSAPASLRMDSETYAG